MGNSSNISEEKHRYLQDQINNRYLPEVRAFFSWETPRAQDSTLVKSQIWKIAQTHMYVDLHSFPWL